MHKDWYEKTRSAYSDVAAWIRVAGENLLKAFKTNEEDNRSSSNDGNYLNITLYIY